VMTDLTWSGGWRQRIPFQLTFADKDGGLRGFRNSDVGGGRRVVGRVEDRYLIGRYKQVATVAVGGFADAGKIWAGDSPFGVNTPVYASVGFSLLAALPPQSHRTFRADFAFPVRGDRRGRGEVRLVVTDFTRIFRMEPRDIFNSRERSVPSSVFNWP
jgi:outer membrane protein assembly factor BamA